MIGELGRCGVSGGGTYDALVGATARHHRATLLTSDERARATYERLGVVVAWVGAASR